MKSLAAFSVLQLARAILVGVFAVLLVVSATLAQSSPDSPEKKAPRGKMTFEPHTLPFGRVQLGTSDTLPVTLSNTSAVAISVTKIATAGAGFAASQNCLGTLAATTGTCVVSVTFTPTKGKNAKGTKVTGTLTITDNASNSPQKVTLSATEFGPASGGPTPTPTPGSSHPTPTPTPGTGGGTPFAIEAAGIYVFNTGQGVSPAQIIQYSTNTSTGATSESTTTTAGTGLESLVFTQNGKYAYGLDSAGDIWGYSVQSSSGALTSVGSPTAPPTGAGMPGLIEPYDSSELWVPPAIPSSTSVTVQQYPINSDGTLGAPTAVTLTGTTIRSFTPSSSSVPTAVWALGSTGSDFLSTLNVYPVNSDGTISGTSIQTITVPEELTQATTGAFAYGVGGTLNGPTTLYSFSLSADGKLTANSTVSLPTPTDLWSNANFFPPAIGSTIDLIDVASNFLVYSVTADGSVGTTPLQTTAFAAFPQFPHNFTINPVSGPSLSQLPAVWVHTTGSTTIDEFAINSDGTIGTSPSGSVATGSGVEGLTPGQNPLSYGLDATSGTVYGYQVSSSGALTALGSFVPTLPSGATLTQTAPFEPVSFSTTPVALFLYTQDNSGGAIVVYPLAANGMPSPSATPLDTILTPGEATESYLVFHNGQVDGFLFGGE